MSREVETEQEIRLELRARPTLIALAAIAQGRRARGGLAAGRGRTSPRAAIGPKGARAMTKLEEQRPQTSRSRQCAPPACASSTPWTIIKNTDVEIETSAAR